jgi:hypothetical protein
MAFKRNRIIWGILVLWLSLCAGPGDCLAQSPLQGEQEPTAKLGEIYVRIREIESTPSPLRMLEVHVQVLNQSRKVPIPAGSVRVRVTPEEILYAGADQPSRIPPDPEEVTLPSQILPGAGQFIYVGFSLDKGSPQSATFEIQINPPRGDQKTISTRF